MTDFIHRFSVRCHEHILCYLSVVTVLFLVFLSLLYCIFLMICALRAAAASLEFHNCLKGNASHEYNDIMDQLAYRSLRRRYINEIKTRRAKREARHQLDQTLSSDAKATRDLTSASKTRWSFPTSHNRRMPRRPRMSSAHKRKRCPGCTRSAPPKVDELTPAERSTVTRLLQ